MNRWKRRTCVRVYVSGVCACSVRWRGVRGVDLSWKTGNRRKCEALLYSQTKFVVMGAMYGGSCEQ